jgi:hypothetical protein
MEGDEVYSEHSISLAPLVQSIVSFNNLTPVRGQPNVFKDKKGHEYQQKAFAEGEPFTPACFSQFLRSIIDNFAIREHPFVFPIELWSPFDQFGHPNPVALTAFVKTAANIIRLNDRGRVGVLRCIAHLLRWLEIEKIQVAPIDPQAVYVDLAGSLPPRVAYVTWSRQSTNYTGVLVDLWESVGAPDPPDRDLPISQIADSHPISPAFRSLCDDFKTKRLEQFRFSAFLSPTFISDICMSPAPNRWRLLRKLIQYAEDSQCGAVFAFLGLLYQNGIGVDPDGKMAYRCYQRCGEFDREGMLLRYLRRSPNPMVRAQAAVEEGDIATAAAEFPKCTDLLGVAHYADFLLRSNDPAVAKEGERILRAAAKKECPFAHFAIGRLEMRREKFREAATAFGAAAEKGYPDAAWLAGCACVETRDKNAVKWFEKARDSFADSRAKELLSN